jgi:hypothetical protein
LPRPKSHHQVAEHLTAGRLRYDNIRISRAKIYQNEAYRGYIASKRRYFYGLEIHIMVTKRREPAEFFISPGSFSDVACLDQFDFDLPPGATVYVDKIYNDYLVEDCLQEDGGIDFSPFRKSNSKRPDPPRKRFLQHHYRKIVETSASLSSSRKIMILKIKWEEGR